MAHHQQTEQYRSRVHIGTQQHVQSRGGKPKRGGTPKRASGGRGRKHGASTNSELAQGVVPHVQTAQLQNIGMKQPFPVPATVGAQQTQSNSEVAGSDTLRGANGYDTLTVKGASSPSPGPTTTANAAQGLQQVPPAMQNQQWIGYKESLSNATDEFNR